MTERSLSAQPPGTPDAARVLQPVFTLAEALRGAGFAIAPDQVITGIAAIGVLGPRGLSDVYNALRAAWAIAPERRAEFDAIFRAVMAGQALAVPVQDASAGDDVVFVTPTGGQQDVTADDSADPLGAEASQAERLSARALEVSQEQALEDLRHLAQRHVPLRRTARRRRAKAGDRIDIRRALRAAGRMDGDPVELPRTARILRQRRVLCLVDVSGSMKAQTDTLLGFAHALVQGAERCEILTLGTRLTRITSSLRPSDRTQALERAGSAIADLDGGTRLGAGLDALLAVTRLAGFARGALVLVLSDGLEREDPQAMALATARLSRLAWQLHWLTPLAGDPAYQPRTAALSAARPWIDVLGDASSARALAGHVLRLARSR